MKKITLTFVLLAICLIGNPGPTFAADAGQLQIPTVTRLVQQFSALENSLIESVRKQDSTALQKTLADDFEMRISSSPGVPTPRAEWIKHLLKEPMAISGIEQMAVHDLGNIAVVSFLGRRQVANAGTASGNLFIVDVWIRSQGAWRLSTRYASPAGRPSVCHPGRRNGNANH